nr:hypothetical protein [Streptomyces scabichelini]
MPEVPEVCAAADQHDAAGRRQPVQEPPDQQIVAEDIGTERDLEAVGRLLGGGGGLCARVRDHGTQWREPTAVEQLPYRVGRLAYGVE